MRTLNLNVLHSTAANELHGILNRLEKFELPLRSIRFNRFVDDFSQSSAVWHLCRRLHSGALPYFVGSLNTQMFPLVYSFTDLYGIPYLTWDANFQMYYDQRRGEDNTDNTEAESGQFFTGQTCRVYSMRPDLTQPLTDFLVEWHWHRFAYVYTSIETFYRMEQVRAQLYDMYGGESIDVYGIYLSSRDPEQNRRQLAALDRQLAGLSERNIVVDIAGKASILRLIDSLRLMGMLRREYHYIILDFGILELPLGPYKVSDVNITGFQVLNYKDKGTVEFLKKWSAYTSSGVEIHQIAFILDSISAFENLQTNLMTPGTQPPQWRRRGLQCPNKAGRLPLLDLQNSQEAAEDEELENWANQLSLQMSELQFKGHTGHIQFDNATCSRDNYTLLLTQFSGERGSRVIANWTRAKKWSVVGDYHPRAGGHGGKGLQNRTIRVVSILSQPFMMYKTEVAAKSPMRGKENFEGYCKELADSLFEELGLDYELHLVKDGKYGARDPINKTWNGIIGELLRGEADVAIAPLTVSAIREQYIDFTEPFMTFGLSVIIKKPEKKTKPGTFSFLLPLGHTLWITIGISCFMVSVGLYVISRISPYETRRSHATSEGFTFANSLWFSFAAFVHEGVDISPVSPGARILSSTWWYFSIVIMAYYTANLAAFLSVERLVSPIANVKDLVNERGRGIRVGTLDSGSTKEFFRTTATSPYNQLYAKMQRDTTVYAKTIEDGVQRVRNGHGTYAFILESKMIEFINFRKPCNTMRVGENIGTKEYAVALPNHTPGLPHFKENITTRILSLREMQKLRKLYIKWWIDKGECTEASDGSSSASALALVNLSGVFYILIAGILIAYVLRVVICLWESSRRRREKRQLGQGFTTFVATQTIPTATMTTAFPQVGPACMELCDLTTTITALPQEGSRLVSEF